MESISTEAQDLLTISAAYIREGKDSEAALILRQLLADEPRNRAAIILLSFVLELQKNYRGALAVLAPMAADSPELFDRVVRLAERTGDESLALQVRRQRVAMTPGSPELCSDLAVALSRASQHAEAVKWFERAEVLEPGFVERNVVERACCQRSKAALSAEKQ